MVVPRGGTGIRSIRCGVHLEISNFGAMDLAGDAGVAGSEFFGAERHAEVDGLARG